MKKTIAICILSVLIIFLSINVQGQITDKFGAQIMALSKAAVQDIKGKELSDQQTAHVYDSKLKLTGFNVTYAESMLGNVLSANFLQTGSDEIMDNIADKFVALPYVKVDSKNDKKILGTGLFASNLKRKIKLLNIDGSVLLTVELDTDNKISIQFLNK